jgi:hypothetical protein
VRRELLRLQVELRYAFFFPSAGIGERGEITERAVSPSRRGGSLDARGGAAFAREEEEEEASELPDARFFFLRVCVFFEHLFARDTQKKRRSFLVFGNASRTASGARGFSAGTHPSVLPVLPGFSGR